VARSPKLFIRCPGVTEAKCFMSFLSSRLEMIQDSPYIIVMS